MNRITTLFVIVVSISDPFPPFLGLRTFLCYFTSVLAVHWLRSYILESHWNTACLGISVVADGSIDRSCGLTRSPVCVETGSWNWNFVYSFNSKITRPFLSCHIIITRTLSHNVTLHGVVDKMQIHFTERFSIRVSAINCTRGMH